MDNNVDAPPTSTTSSSFLTPLLISMVGIVSTCLIIVIYHLIVTRYCRRRRQGQTTATERWVAEREFLTGVEEKVLETIPIIAYSSENCIDGQCECAVCIGEFEDGEMVRVLPNCKHAFHVPCIDQWFIGHASCPICRSPIVALSSNSEPTEVGPSPLYVDCDQDRDHDRMIIDGDAPVNVQTSGLLRHCVSLALPRDKKPRPPVLMGLKRSLSMDQTSIIIDIERDCRRDDSSSPSSSLKGDLTKSGSIKHFDRVPMKLWRSFSRLSLGRQNSGILPY